MEDLFMDLVFLLILLVFVVFFFRDIKWITYAIGTMELFFRLIHWLGDHIGLSDVNGIINKYLPESLFSVIGKYTSGIIYDILSWILFGFFVFWFVYLIKYFSTKK